MTRWETRTETVRRPVARRELVPERVVERVPVTERRMVEEEVTRRVAISNDPFDGRPTVANRNAIGGTQLQSDPPREGTDWRLAAFAGSTQPRGQANISTVNNAAAFRTGNAAALLA